MGFNKAIKTVYFLCLLLCVAQADLLSFLESVGDKVASGSTEPSGIKPAAPSGPKLSTATDARLTGPEVFDVTKNGAVADGKKENTKAFLDTWTAACAYAGKSTFLVPEGEFLLGSIELNGPCYNNASPAVVIKGTLKAVEDPSQFPTDGWISFRDLKGLSISGGGTLDGQGELTWSTKDCHHKKCKMSPSNIKLNKLFDVVIHDIYVTNSKGFHINFFKCDGAQIYNVNVNAPEDSPNTDGIHLSRCTNFNITSSHIGVGDDCISIGTGNHDIYVTNVYCGPGHGISVGSLGKYKNEEPVTGIHVKNCTLNGTTNGVRIKTWPGAPALEVSNFTFEDIIMKDAQFPIIIDQKYCPSKRCSDEPSGIKISNILYKNIRGTSFSKLAVNLDCSSSTPCENIQLSNIDLQYQDPTASLGSLCYHAKVVTSGVQKPAPCLLTQ